MRIIERIVGPADQGRKVKYYLRSAFLLSSHQCAQLRAAEGIRVNGALARSNDLLCEGDRVQVCLPEDSPGSCVPKEDQPVNILYEDEDLIIIDKPAPLATQFSSRTPEKMALENRLAARYGEGFVFRPLNRLDRGTSGLLAAAKHAYACQVLQRDLHSDRFVREYLAVVEGRLEGQGTLTFPIAKEAAATVRRIVDFQNGKPAATHYRAEGFYGNCTLVRLRLETGRTHQIRLHMAHIGHPVIGDFLYGREDTRLPGRFALHSAALRLIHPVTGETMEWISPLPDALRALLS